MSFNVIDIGKKEYNKEERKTSSVKSRYPLMAYPNGIFDVSKMKGMHVSRIWETSDLDHKKDYYTYAVYIVLDNGMDFRISEKYDNEAAARAELENYIRELWSIVDELVK